MMLPCDNTVNESQLGHAKERPTSASKAQARYATAPRFLGKKGFWPFMALICWLDEANSISVDPLNLGFVCGQPD